MVRWEKPENNEREVTGKRKRDASDVGKKKVNGWREIPKKGDGVQSKGGELHF